MQLLVTCQSYLLILYLILGQLGRTLITSLKDKIRMLA